MIKYHLLTLTLIDSNADIIIGRSAVRTALGSRQGSRYDNRQDSSITTSRFRRGSRWSKRMVISRETACRVADTAGGRL